MFCQGMDEGRRGWVQTSEATKKQKGEPGRTARLAQHGGEKASVEYADLGDQPRTAQPYSAGHWCQFELDRRGPADLRIGRIVPASAGRANCRIARHLARDRRRNTRGGIVHADWLG